VSRQGRPLAGHGNRLPTIGKSYVGLSDVEIAERTPLFLAHRNGRRSNLRESGFAMRSPRIVRLRRAFGRPQSCMFMKFVDLTHLSEVPVKAVTGASEDAR
jgi:hypothetical protein